MLARRGCCIKLDSTGRECTSSVVFSNFYTLNNILSKIAHIFVVCVAHNRTQVFVPACTPAQFFPKKSEKNNFFKLKIDNFLKKIPQ